jgi:hypothetical protein
MSREEVEALIDGYLLGDQTDRESVFRKIAGWHTEIESAAPILRAIALVGSRAADESLMALRLSLSGHPVSDQAVKELKAATAAIRHGEVAGRDRYFASLKGASKNRDGRLGSAFSAGSSSPEP